MPSHTLFISMYYKIIDPIEVFKSNVANSFGQAKISIFEYNYCLSPSMDTKTIEVRVGRITILLKDIMLWLLGIFYNALFWNIGMILWFRLA